MALPGTNAQPVIKVEVDAALTGIAPLTTAPVITAPTENQAVIVEWNETLYTTNVTFTWTAAAGASTYEIEISDEPEFLMSRTLLIATGAVLTYNVLAYYLPINKDLYVRVRGVDATGYSLSPWSEVITFSVTKEVLKEGLERVELTTDSGTEKQYFQAVRDPEDGKKNVTIKGLMKLKVAVDVDDTPLTYVDFLKDGDIWYDETSE